MGFVLLTGEKLLSCSGLLTCYEAHQMTTHRSEVVPEYEPGGTRGEADTADDKVEQTDDKKACTAGNTKHRDQGFFHQTWSVARARVSMVKIIGFN